MARTRHMIVALSGVLIGHEIVHAIPHHHANEAAHGYIPMLSALVLPIGLVALIGLVRQGLAEGRSVVRPGQIAAMQVYLFATQELVESMTVGTSMLGFVTDPVMWAGLVVQVGMAWLIVTALTAIRWLLLTSSGVVSTLVEPHRPLAGAVAGWAPRPDPRFARLTTRGPPIPVL